MFAISTNTTPGVTRRRGRLVWLVIAMAIGVFAITAIAGTGDASADARSLAWASCADGAEGWQCASLAVPIDYGRPSGGSIDIALTRLPASDPARRIGPLVINFGGPGGEAVSNLHDFGKVMFSDEIRARFDIVGFDPRGVGASSGLNCKIDLATYYAVDLSPDTPAERQALIDAGRMLAEGCQKNGGRLLAHMGTDDVVKDLEQLRSALGAERFSFWGPSYGTSIAVEYAEHYPNRVRAFSIEDVLATDVDGSTLFKEVAVSYEWSFNAFLADCAATPACAFYSNGDPASAFDALMTRLEVQPLVAPDDRRPISQSDILGLVDSGLWAMARWPQIAEVLQAAADGDAATLRAIVDDAQGRHADGTYETPGSFYAFVAVHCLDNSFPRTLPELDAVNQEVMRLAPRTGAIYMNVGYACLSWPAPHRPQPTSPTGRGLPPILVVGGTEDMQTPYVQALRLAQQLPSSVLLTREGAGHTSYWLSDCVRQAVDRYFLELKLPAAGTRCQSTGGLFSKHED